MAGHYGMGSLFRRGRIWWITYNRQGRQFRESSGSAERADAIRLLQRRTSANLPASRVTVDHLLNLVVDDYIANQKRSISDLKMRVDVHLRPALGKMRADQLSTHAIQDYIEARRLSGVRPATINRELAALKRAL